METKVCTRCLEQLPVTDFWSNGNKRTPNDQRRRAQCKECMRQFMHKNLYGLDYGEYDVMLEAQNGVCAICGKEPTGRRLAIDHSHKTGKVRGLLCFICNSALGRVNDDIDHLYALIDYLKEHD